MVMYLGTKQLKLVNAYVIKSNNIRSLQRISSCANRFIPQSSHRIHKQQSASSIRTHHTRLSMMAKSSITTNNNWEYITNHKTSKTVKLFKSVLRANKSKRSELGLTVAEGVRLVTDILANEESRRLVRRIVISEEIDYTDEYQQKLEHWLSIVDEESRQRKEVEQIDGTCSINIGTSEVVSACSGTVTSQGVAALLDVPPQYNPKDETIYKPSNNNIPPFYLILDGLADPGNVGTLLRSCKASYVTACILLPGSCDVFNPKAVRSAMGASFSVPILDMSKTSEQESLEEVLKLLKDFGIDNSRVFGATMESSGSSNTASLAHYNIDFTNKAAAIILGKEGEGLRSPVLNAIKQGKISTVHVPMAKDMESLNAAVCGSIIMFERMRQLA